MWERVVVGMKCDHKCHTTHYHATPCHTTMNSTMNLHHTTPHHTTCSTRTPQPMSSVWGLGEGGGGSEGPPFFSIIGDHRFTTSVIGGTAARATAIATATATTTTTTGTNAACNGSARFFSKKKVQL